MARRRKNPPKCSIDVADYGIDIGDYADNLMEIMNDEFLDHSGQPYWMALALEACVDPDTSEIFWVALWTIDTSEYLGEDTAQIGLCISDDFEDVVTNIKTSAGATVYSTPEQRMFAHQNASVYFAGGSKKTGLSMLMKAGQMLDGLEQQTIQSASERGFDELYILAIGAEDKRRNIFNRALRRFGYIPMNPSEYPAWMPMGVVKHFR